MEVISSLTFVTKVGELDRNIEVKIEENNLELGIDKKHLFRTLKHRKEIVGLINKKLDELVEDYISKSSDRQEQGLIIENGN